MFDNFKNLGNVMKMMGQAKQQAAAMQAELEKASVTGEAGAGAVCVTLNGLGKARRVDVDPALFAGLVGDDKTMAEELIAAAFNDAADKVEQIRIEKMRELTGGMDLPGMDPLIEPPDSQK